MSDRRDDDLQELAAAYALGALDPEATKAFEAHLARHPELAREVAEYREVSALLALATPGPAPAADLERRVAERMARERAAARRPAPTRPGWMPWLALAAGLAAVALGLVQGDLRQRLAERERLIAALRDSLARREARLAEREATLNALLEPDVVLARLTSATTPEPGIQLFWNRRNNRAIVHAFNLAPAGTGRAYQLWFIPKTGKPIPSVVFNSEPSGHALVQQIEVPAGVPLTAAAVTEEPAGGSPEPTTTPILVGPLGAS